MQADDILYHDEMNCEQSKTVVFSYRISVDYVYSGKVLFRTKGGYVHMKNVGLIIFLVFLSFSPYFFFPLGVFCVLWGD